MIQWDSGRSQPLSTQYLLIKKWKVVPSTATLSLLPSVRYRELSSPPFHGTSSYPTYTYIHPYLSALEPWRSSLYDKYYLLYIDTLNNDFQCRGSQVVQS